MLESFFGMLKDILIFSSYVDGKNSFPKPLSKEKEKEYLILAKNGDEKAKELLISHNLRLVAHIAKKYSNYNDSDELISVGSIGLIKAINTYKVDKGTGLATYASRCIENEILMTLRSGKKHKNDVSLYDAVGVDRDGNELSLIDLISTEADTVIDKVEISILMERLKALIKKTLDEREYKIISLRYGLDSSGCLTQREVADFQNISRSYVSRIEKKALEKIKCRIKEEDLYFD